MSEELETRRILTYHEDSDCEIIIEELNAIPYLHVYVFSNMTKSLIKKLNRIWNNLEYDLYWTGYEYLYCYTQNIRFCKLFRKYEKVTEVIDEYGNKYEVIRWDLKLV